MEIKRIELLEAIDKVQAGIAKKELIEQSTYFVFKDSRVWAYNDEILISHPLPGFSETIAVHYDKFSSVVRKLETETISMELVEGQLILKGGRSRAGIVIQSEIKLPIEDVQRPKKWEEIPEGFLIGLDSARGFCAGRQTSQPVLSCVNVADGKLESSNNFCAYQYKWAGIQESYLIPADTCRDILKINPIYMAFSVGWAHYKSEDGTELSCRILQGERFPQLEHVLKVEGESVELPKNIKEALERVSSISTQCASDISLNVKLKDKRVRVFSESEFGWFEEELNIKYTGPELDFWVTPALITTILGSQLSCIIGNDRIFFQGENWKYVCALKKKL